MATYNYNNNNYPVNDFPTFDHRIVAKEEDRFALTPSHDMSGSGYPFMEYTSEVSNFVDHYYYYYYLDAVPMADQTLLSDPLYSSLDIEPRPEDLASLTEWNNNYGTWTETTRAPLLLCNNEEGAAAKTKAKRCKQEDTKITKVLTREKISEYFYMPITQAAKDLNVGLTLLKKRCRALGIRRWPHRKLMSLQTLIKNLQEMRKVDDEGSEEKLKEAIEILEKEKRLLEEVPDMELKHKTKRLRQACFKANYKKRKQMSLKDNSHDHLLLPPPSNYVVKDENSNDINGDHHRLAENYNEEDDEIDCLLYDSYSSDNLSYFGFN